MLSYISKRLYNALRNIRLRLWAGVSLYTYIIKDIIGYNFMKNSEVTCIYLLNKL